MITYVTQGDFLLCPAKLGVERQGRLEQHLSAGGAVLARGALGLVVAQAVLAGHENHGRRRDLGEVHGVVAGAGDDIAMRVPEGLGARSHRRHAIGMEADGGKIVQLPGLDRDLDLAADRVDGGIEARLHRRQHRVVVVAQIDRHAHHAGDDVGRVGPVHLDAADRADRRRGVGQRDPLHLERQARARDHGIGATRHRRRPRMALPARDGRLVPAYALHAGDDAYGLVLGLQDRTLLDVELEVG